MNPRKSRLYQYGQNVNTHDLIKVVAITLMIIDHLGFYLLDNNLVLRFLGRGAAPLFYFLIGYSGKLNCRPSLFIYGTILSLTSIFLSNKFLWVNILFTFFFAHLLLTKIPIKKMPVWLTSCFVFALMLLNSWLYVYVEYGTLGILIALTVHWHKEKLPCSSIWLILATGYYFLWQGLVFHLFDAAWSTYGIVIMATICWGIFYHYKLVKIDNYPRWLITPTLVISRYSLEIYFLHLVLFQGIYLINYSKYFFNA